MSKRHRITPTLQKLEGFRAKAHTEAYKIRRVIPPSGGIKGETVAGYQQSLDNTGSEVLRLSRGVGS